MAAAVSKKSMRWLLVGLFVVPVVACGLIYNAVENGNYTIYSDVSQVPAMPAAVVFGAGIQSREVHDRVVTAVALYKSGKVKKILMTGDNGHITYNEPEAMKRDAMQLGVPAADVACDYAGFRTYDSVYRAIQIFGLDKAVFVTQRYHLPRAMYLARHLGLDVVGLDASVQSYGAIQSWYDLREMGAAQAAWLDVAIGRKPKFLGKKEPIFPPQSAAPQAAVPQTAAPQAAVPQTATPQATAPQTTAP